MAPGSHSQCPSSGDVTPVPIPCLTPARSPSCWAETIISSSPTKWNEIPKGEQLDWKISHLRLRPLQHHLLGGLPHLRLHQHRLSVQYLYKENLVNLGEIYYGATKRIFALHNKISDKPDISWEIDGYVQEQINNKNYVKINVEEARKDNQLHFVG